jgi:transposase
MGEYSEAFVAFDVWKTKHAVAIANGGRRGEVRFVGEIASSPAAVERLIRKLGGRYGRLHFCYEAGPIGYGGRAAAHKAAVRRPSSRPRKAPRRRHGRRYPTRG